MSISGAIKEIDCEIRCLDPKFTGSHYQEKEVKILTSKLELVKDDLKKALKEFKGF